MKKTVYRANYHSIYHGLRADALGHQTWDLLGYKVAGSIIGRSHLSEKPRYFKVFLTKPEKWEGQRVH